MKTKEVIRIIGFSFSIIIATILFTGCVTYQDYQAYDGSVLPRNQVAVVEWAALSFGLVQVDNIGFFTRKIPNKMELLPGQHTIKFRPHGYLTGDTIVRDINVEAGKTYRVRMMILDMHAISPQLSEGHWDFEIIEEK